MYTLKQVQKFIYQYNPSGIILDTNILIVFLIGYYDLHFLEECELVNGSSKRYSTRDFELLNQILKMFKKIVVTPEVLAEVSNLSITKGIKGSHHLPYLKKVIDFLQKVEEQHQEIQFLWGMKIEVIGRFGLTDLTLIELSKRTLMPILTDEFELYQYGYERVPIIKYSNIKNQALQSLLN